MPKGRRVLPLLRSELVGGALASGLFQGLNVPLTLLISIVLAKGLGVAGFGQYAIYTASAAVLSLPLTWGLATLMLRELSVFAGVEQPSLIKGYVAVAGGLMAIYALLLLIAVHSWSMLTSWPDSGAYTVVVWFVIVQSAIALLSNIFKALGWSTLGQLPLPLLVPLLMLVQLALVFVTDKHRLTAEFALLLLAIASSAVLCICYCILWFRVTRGAVITWPSIDRRAWFTSIVHFSLSGLLNNIKVDLPVLMLGWFSSPEMSGLFRIAQRGLTFLTFVHNALASVIGARLARAAAVADTSALRRVLSASALISSAWALMMFGVFWVWGQPLLSLLFGAVYAASYPVLLVLAVGGLAMACSGFSGQLLMMNGHEKLVSHMLLLNAFIVLCLFLGVGSNFTAYNVALIVTTATVVVEVLSAIVVFRLLGINTSIFSLSMIMQGCRWIRRRREN